MGVVLLIGVEAYTLVAEINSKDKQADVNFMMILGLFTKKEKRSWTIEQLKYIFISL